ncbi:MAG: type II toxin-antitoxin system VapC family toxin [Halothiobacillaceae bacterium]|jgi:predicted nucleic-acid-binding protein|nr:type II toxin-antitoxin system VapC family toxin [Halothiobacillaceae bacterium]
MIAVDTNVIVRLATRDDETQFFRAREVFRHHDVFVPDTVLLETVWVLGYAYGFEREQIAKALSALCGQANVRLANEVMMAQVIQWYRAGMDFADALHLAQSASCEMLLTFDARFIKKAKKLSRCKVAEPPV